MSRLYRFIVMNVLFAATAAAMFGTVAMAVPNLLLACLAASIGYFDPPLSDAQGRSDEGEGQP